MRNPGLLGTALAVAGQVLASSSAVVYAQPSSTSLSLTYSLLRDSEGVLGEGQNFPIGVSVAVSRRLHGSLAATAELSLSTRRDDFSATGGGTFDSRYESFHAGPRVSVLQRGRARPYLEVLAGVTRWRIRERGSPIGWESNTDFSLQAGIGLDLLFTQRVALRLAGDLRLLFEHDSRFDNAYRTEQYRVDIGLAFQLGKL